jgi:hypothetical protein
VQAVGAFVGKERRHSTPEERKEYAVANGKNENGGVVISVSRRTVIAFALAVLGLGGGGTAAVKLLPAAPQSVASTVDIDEAIEKNASVAVLKEAVANIKDDLREIKGMLRRQERNNR